MTTANSDLKHRAERRMAALAEIAEQRALLAEYRADDKAAGFDERALARVIKEMAAPPEKVRAQLELELVVDTYRETLGVPTTVEAADRVIREAKGKPREMAGADAPWASEAPGKNS